MNQQMQSVSQIPNFTAQPRIQCNQIGHEREVISHVCLRADCREQRAHCRKCNLIRHRQCVGEIKFLDEIEDQIQSIDQPNMQIVHIIENAIQKFEHILKEINSTRQFIQQYNDVPNLSNLNIVAGTLNYFSQQNIDKLHEGQEKLDNLIQSHYMPQFNTLDSVINTNTNSNFNTDNNNTDINLNSNINTNIVISQNSNANTNINPNFNDNSNINADTNTNINQSSTNINTNYNPSSNTITSPNSNTNTNINPISDTKISPNSDNNQSSDTNTNFNRSSNITTNPNTIIDIPPSSQVNTEVNTCPDSIPDPISNANIDNSKNETNNNNNNSNINNNNNNNNRNSNNNRRIVIDELASEQYLQLGQLHYKRQRYAEALELYDLAIVLDPNCPVAWNNKGTALGRLSRNAESIECFDRALEIINSRPQIDQQAKQIYQANKASALQRLQQFDNSIQTINESIALDPQKENLIQLKFLSLLQSNQFNEALHFLDEASQQDSSNHLPFQLKVGIVLHQQNKFGEAIEQLGLANSIEPTKETYLYLGKALEELSQFDEAEQCYKEALELDQNYHEAQQHLTQIQQYNQAKQ